MQDMKAVLAAIAARRADSAFTARLQRSLATERDVLDRLSR
jgi:hypothetical protein